MIHTHQTVHDLIQSRWESDTPDKILAALRPYEGKPFTTRLLDKLPGGKDVWQLRKQYGMTHLQNRAYSQSSGNAADGVSLLLAHTESCVNVDTRDIEQRNPAYFSARRERNHRRMEAMNSKATLDAIAAAMNRAETAIINMLKAAEAVEELTAYGTTLDPDRYAIEKACGLDDKDGRPFINRDYSTRLVQSIPD